MVKKGPLNDVGSASEAFKFFFEEALLQIIVEETNRYANQFINSNQDHLKPWSRVHQWKNTDDDELYVFFSHCKC